MDVLGRGHAPFSGRVWQEIDRAVEGVKAANCTARRFLEIDGPYGLGLTSLTGDDDWIDAHEHGAQPDSWGVVRAVPRRPTRLGYDLPTESGVRGTFLTSAPSRPVPMISSEFLLGIRNVEAFDDECQPLDVSRAVRAARDVALEEERLIYYGNAAADAVGLVSYNIGREYLRFLLNNADEHELADLYDNVDRDTIERALRHHPTDDIQNVIGQVRTYLPNACAQADPIAAQPEVLRVNEIEIARGALPTDYARRILNAGRATIDALANRGFPGPYALAVSPIGYGLLFQTLRERESNILIIELFREFFQGGIHSVPVLQPATHRDPRRSLSTEPVLAGEVVATAVACSRSHLRLVVGRDWTVSYGGRTSNGVYHRFSIMTSLRLEVCDRNAIQVIVSE